MSLTTKGHDYDHEEMIVENGSEEVGQEKETVEKVENYLKESDDIANATPDSLALQGDA